MELLYVYIKKFRNYVDVEVNFSDKFIIKYNKNKDTMYVKKNKQYVSIYPKYISNINAIVGVNSVGKTNLLDLIGLRKIDREKDDSEFKIKYKKNKKGFIKVSDIEGKVKNSIYLFVYYFGKDNNTGEELFCVEGNDLECFYDIFQSYNNIKSKYFVEKYWFSFICTYNNGKFLYKYDVNIKLENYKIKHDLDGIKVYGDYRSEHDKRIIISVRESLNTKYYDEYSLKADDESYIMIPRRVASFNTKYVKSKVDMLYNQIINKNSQMYNDEKYILNIEYTDIFLQKLFLEENEFLNLKYSYKNSQGKEKYIYRLLESYVRFYFQSFKSNLATDEENKKLENCKGQIEKFVIKLYNNDSYKNYYYNLVKLITDNMIEDNMAKKHIMKCYESLSNSLFNNNCYILKNNNLVIEIDKDSQLDSIYNILNVTIDEKVNSDSVEMFSVFGNFFSYSIYNLSYGENAYLGLFSSIYEQIKELTDYKEEYILALDEPEVHMHPELARNFVNDLIKFLGDIKKDNQKFQLIVSTHSPFILSDIPNGNIVFLDRDSKGKCEIVENKVSTFGQNIHTLLKNGFFMETATIGEFANQEIKKSIRILDKYNQFNDKKISEKEMKIEYIKYMGLQKNRKINIEKMEIEIKSKIKYLIKIIGEPLIKRKLQEMYNAIFPSEQKDYELKIRKLQQEKDKLKQIINEKGLNNIDNVMRLLDNAIKELQLKADDNND